MGIVFLFSALDSPSIHNDHYLHRLHLIIVIHTMGNEERKWFRFESRYY